MACGAWPSPLMSFVTGSTWVRSRKQWSIWPSLQGGLFHGTSRPALSYRTAEPAGESPMAIRSVQTVVVCALMALTVRCARVDWAFDTLAADSKMSWSDGMRRITVAKSGEVEFSDDDNSGQNLSDGGFLVIEENNLLAVSRLEGPSR